MQNKLIYGIILMIFSASCTAVGQAFWKMAVSGIYSWQLYVGFSLYGMGAILMIIAFRFGELSVLHPLLSIGYVFAIVIGVVFLNEKLTTMQVFGNIFVMSGAIMMGISGYFDKERNRTS
ncbi:EamA/RhaT family transporter [Listeria booriae]|uniref:EamA/RhaT family transporter n=1 Tax=Listeria booriae TaxID=1552123 RepID=UPI001625625C|nr:EamA/RhaT family transporter [Listeria booriae]MBC2077847.1 EamA/RhaT family transporter [Listeria booriae]